MKCRLPAGWDLNPDFRCVKHCANHYTIGTCMIMPCHINKLHFVRYREPTKVISEQSQILIPNDMEYIQYH